MRSACTHSPELAAQRQAEKLFGPSLISVAEVKEGNVFIRRFVATADPEVNAFCWANGRIQIADPVPDGALSVAVGPERALFEELCANAQKGKGDAEAWLLVPGVADAGNPIDAVDALTLWLGLRAHQVNGSKNCYGVQYTVPKQAVLDTAARAAATRLAAA
ncbi:MAG: hypothetical protein Q8R98_20870 [Rubrivivax sp.]|nr:hypothetical protein [Rubrivivax sp.]